MVMLIFIADSHLRDQAVPLRSWHRHLFKKSCTIRTLNLAIVNLLKSRNYRLRLDHLEINAMYMSLIAVNWAVPMRRSQHLVDI